MSHAPVPTIWMEGVVPSTSVYTAGAGNFRVPKYNRLVIKAWGPGGGGSNFTVTPPTHVSFAGQPGSADSIVKNGSTYLLRAKAGGGSAASTGSGGGAGAGGGAAYGNTVNLSGAPGTHGLGAGQDTGQPGGNAANGGLGGAQGQTGGAPGGGGGGGAGGEYTGGTGGGGGGGGYSYSVFAPGVTGAPVTGSLLSWSLGNGGAAGAGTYGAAGAGAGGAPKIAFVVS